MALTTYWPWFMTHTVGPRERELACAALPHRFRLEDVELDWGHLAEVMARLMSRLNRFAD
ncbi:hypothetical protein [Streptomyces gossypiisoli]|uniref:hypothetical protein n=1 Tax=Streptomyces gossypiisoli TaxID=2748864 RepID=UPI0015DA52DF|nr:hypothetical protein [Streptomyces gossypiisoli]